MIDIHAQPNRAGDTAVRADSAAALEALQLDAPIARQLYEQCGLT